MTDGLIAIDFDDLRNDAELWETAGQKLNEAMQAGADQDPPNTAFMMVGYSLAEGYRDLNAQFVDQMRAGVKQLSVLASVLRDTADDFTHREQENIETINSLTAEMKSM